MERFKCYWGAVCVEGDGGRCYFIQINTTSDILVPGMPHSTDIILHCKITFKIFFILLKSSSTSVVINKSLKWGERPTWSKPNRASWRRGRAQGRKRGKIWKIMIKNNNPFCLNGMGLTKLWADCILQDLSVEAYSSRHVENSDFLISLMFNAGPPEL